MSRYEELYSDRQSFRTKYPNLQEVLITLALDNGMFLRDRPGIPVNVEKLEALARQLDAVEKMTVAAGERSEAEAIIARYNIQELDEFLESAFQGDLRNMIFE